jgi:hypothetical protein
VRVIRPLKTSSAWNLIFMLEQSEPLASSSSGAPIDAIAILDIRIIVFYFFVNHGGLPNHYVQTILIDEQFSPYQPGDQR